MIELHSRFISVHPIKTNGEAASEVLRFFRFFEKLSGQIVNKIHTGGDAWVLEFLVLVGSPGCIRFHLFSIQAGVECSCRSNPSKGHCILLKTAVRTVGNGKKGSCACLLSLYFPRTIIGLICTTQWGQLVTVSVVLLSARHYKQHVRPYLTCCVPRSRTSLYHWGKINWHPM